MELLAIIGLGMIGFLIGNLLFSRVGVWIATIYAESSPGKKRFFCSHCGTHLVAQRLGKGYLIVRVATLDDDPGVEPDSVSR